MPWYSLVGLLVGRLEVTLENVANRWYGVDRPHLAAASER